MTYPEFLKFCQQNELNVFTINDLKILFKGVSERYLRLKINRWKAKNYLKSPKKGLYILASAVPDEFEIASRLLVPSYVSLESALSHYSIIPDVSVSVTSVTTKNTASFTVEKNRYEYHHLKSALFTDYYHLRNNVFIASMEKAILDFFYFRKPEVSNQFFERLNMVTLKNLNLKKISELAIIYPKTIRKLVNHFKNVISR